MTTTRDDPTTSAALAEVGEASAFPGLRGLRWWGVLLLALVLTAGGVAVDVLREGTLGVVFLAAYPGGCVLASVLAQRRDIFVPMVQPPLLLAVSVPVAVAATGTLPASGGLVSTALAVGAPLINGFPAMAVTTVVCVLIGLVRMRVQRWRPPDTEVRREPVRSGPAAAPTRDARPRDDRGRDRDRDRDRGRDRERAREERDRRDAAERADAAERREQAERERRRAQERARAERDREMAERDRAARERREQELAERERARRDRGATSGSKGGSKKRPKARDERPDDRARPDDREQLARGAAEAPPGPMPRRSPLKGAGRDEAPVRDTPREPAPRNTPPRDQPARDARSREDRMREERLREERGGGRPPGVHPVRERPPERPPR